MGVPGKRSKEVGQSEAAGNAGNAGKGTGTGRSRDDRRDKVDVCVCERGVERGEGGLETERCVHIYMYTCACRQAFMHRHQNACVHSILCWCVRTYDLTERMSGEPLT